MLTISAPQLISHTNICTKKHKYLYKKVAMRMFTALAGFYRPKDYLGLYRRQIVFSLVARSLISSVRQKPEVTDRSSGLGDVVSASYQYSCTRLVKISNFVQDLIGQEITPLLVVGGQTNA